MQRSNVDSVARLGLDLVKAEIQREAGNVVRRHLRAAPNSTPKVVPNGRMKQQRHTAIREVLNQANVPSQDELRRRLAKRGFHVTQATLSRDIHELRLSKGPQGYSLPGNGGDEDEESGLPGILDVLRAFGLEVRQAMNQLVLITTTGSAQPVAAGIDYEDWPEVVGTIAGDDTVLIICPDERQARTLKVRIEEFIG
jgi:transcriptional regulator of arginine metabolism